MGRYRINRSKDRHGDLNSGEEQIKKTAQNSNFEYEGIEAWKKLSAAQKNKASKGEMAERGRDLDQSNKFMKTLADTQVYKRKVTDKPLNIYTVDKMIKKLHHRFEITPSLDVLAGMNGLGHRVFFVLLDDSRDFVCAVGKCGLMTIEPESKFSRKKEGVGEEINYRGWIALIDMCLSYLEKNGIPIRKNDGLDGIITGR